MIVDVEITSEGAWFIIDARRLPAEPGWLVIVPGPLELWFPASEWAATEDRTGWCFEQAGLRCVYASGSVVVMQVREVGGSLRFTYNPLAW